MIGSQARDQLVASTSDVDLSEERDRVQAAIIAVNKTLNRSLWSAARKTPAVARIVAEPMKALADLHRERDALEERNDGLL